MADRIVEVADRLRREMESWRSIEIRATIKQTPLGTPLPESKNLYLGDEKHYIETAVGQRWLDNTTLYSGDLADREQSFTDGRRCANVYFDQATKRQTRVEIQNHFSHEDQIGFTDRPEPLSYFHVGKRPIYEAIRTAESLGEQSMLGRKCDLFLFHKVRLVTGSLDAVYYLDRDTSLPLKVEFYRAGGDRSPGTAVRVWRATTFDSVGGGHHFPLMSENLYFNGRDSDGSNTISVTAIHFDREYAATTFWPTILPGVWVNDLVKQTFTQVPEAGELPAKPKPTATVPTITSSAGSPARAVATIAAPADPPRSWGSIGSSAALGMGVLLIAVAIVSGWRRNH